MTTLTSISTASEHRFYRLADVQEIARLRDNYTGIITGYLPTICGNRNMLPTEEGLEYVLECKESLEKYKEVFGDELNNITGLISKMEAILCMKKDIKGREEK